MTRRKLDSTSISVFNNAAKIAFDLKPDYAGESTPEGLGKLFVLSQKLAHLAYDYALMVSWQSDTDPKSLTRKTKKLQKEIAQIAREINPKIKIIFDDDPRGYSVRLLLPSGKYNTFGGRDEGWGVLGS